jgi:heptosyltransferase-1
VAEPAVALPAVPRRVLVIRLSAIGDLILASGLMPVLAAGWPGAEIHWLTRRANAELLRGDGRLAGLHLLPRGPSRSWWRPRELARVLEESFALVRTLRRQRFDLVLDVQGLLKSGVWARLAGAPVRVGLGSREGSGLLMTHVVSRAVKSHLPGKEYRALCHALGLDTTPYRLGIAVSAAAEQGAGQRLRSAGVAGAYVVLAPFTTRPQKHWLDDRWVECARRLVAERGLRVVVLGGPGDRDHAKALAAHAGQGAVSLAGDTSLGEAAAAIRGARLVVGVDTGLTHLGLAMGTPTLALFGSTRPYLDPAVPNARVLYEPMDCSPCRRRPTCGGAFTCMRRHTVDEVLAAADALLTASSQEPCVTTPAA